MILASGGFCWLDWAVVISYFIGITLFGLWISRRTRTTGGYFLGERKLPWWIMVGQSFGTGTHAEGPVGQAGATAHFGFATIWYQWKNMLITPFYWLLSPWYRRTGRTTIGEIVEDRYGRKLGLVYSIFAVCFFVFSQGAMLKGAAKVVSHATGFAISPNMVVLGMTLAFICYSFFGGLLASAYTDFVQGFLIITLSFMLIPAGLSIVGGFHGMRQSLPPNFFDLMNEQSKITAFTLLMLSINGIVGITAQPHMLTMTATGRNERAGRVGQTYGSTVKRLCTIGWALTGLIVAAMLVQRKHTLGNDPEEAFGYACRELLGPGLVGLLVSCVLAANMSACSNFMVSTGALFTQNFYRKYLVTEASDKHFLLVGRFSGLGLTLMGVLFALCVDQVLQAFLFTETIAALMGIMFFGGILWKRANRHGVLASIVAAFVVYYAINWRITGDVRLVYPWLPGPFGWAMLAGGGLFILVSLLTPAETPERIERFFDSMRRTSDKQPATAQPVAAGGPPSNEEEHRPLGEEVGQDLILIDLPGWFTRDRWRGFFRRYHEDVVGFTLASVTVGLLILLAWGIMQIGR